MFAPKKCGIKYDPPTLVVEYIIIATGKLHRRCMPLRDITGSSDPAKEAQKFKSSPKHGKYLDKISEEKLGRIMGKCVKYLKGTSAISKKPIRINIDDDFLKDDADKDFNKMDDSELMFEKAK